MLLQGLAQNADALVEIGLGLDLAVNLRDQRRQFLPLLLFDVIAESLKNRVGRILRQIGLAGRDRFGEIAVRQLLARLRVGGVHGVVLGAHFVVEALIAGSTLAVDGIGSLAVKLEHHAQLGQSAAYVALLPCIHGGIMDLLFVLAELLVFLFLAVDFRQQLQERELPSGRSCSTFCKASRACG